MKRLCTFLSAAFIFCGVLSQSLIADDIKLRFSWWGGDARHKPTIEVLRLYESKNPGIKISGEYMGWPGYPERLTTQISGGNEPDIMQINWAWITTMYSKNGDGFYDINKAKTYINLAAFGSTLESGTVNGKLNAIPVSYTARGWLWQKSVLDKAGLMMPKTWDDLFALGRKLESKLGKDYYATTGGAYDLALVAHSYMLQKTGKQWIDPKEPKVAFTKAEALEYVKVFRKFYEYHVAMPYQTVLSITGSDTPTEQVQEWITGKWTSSYTWDSSFAKQLSTLPKTTKCDIGDFITMKGAKASGYFGRPSMMFAVSTHSKNPEQAVKFIDFLLNDPEAIRILGDTRGSPMSKIAYDILVKENKFSAVNKKFIDQIMKAKIEMPSPYFEHSKIQELARSIFEAVALGKISDEEAVSRLSDEADKVLRTLK